MDQDSAIAIKKTGYKIFTRLTEWNFKVLTDPTEDLKQDKGYV